MLSADDQLSIFRLIALYGHIVDERQFSCVDELFTEDVVYDMTKRGARPYHGIEAVRALWIEGKRHPLAHHATNIVIDENPDGTADVRSKGVNVRPDGTVHSTTYRQTVVRTEAGWRISYLTAEMRSPEMIPTAS